MKKNMKNMNMNKNSNNIHFERVNLRFLQSSHCPANCLQHVRSMDRAQSFANHAQHIELLFRSTHRVPCRTKGQLSC